MTSLDGIFTAMVTPFKDDGGLDVAALRESARFQILAGAGGLCPLGGTGEPLSMTPDEHRTVIDTVVSEAAGRVPVIVGCLAASQADIIAAGRHAKAAGADALMVIPPYFVVTKPDHTRRHVEAVAAACDLPLVLFNGPSRSGVRLDADAILALVEAVPRIVAVKETSGDITIAAELLRSAPSGFRVLQGFDELVLPTLALGGHGAVLSLGCLVPALLRDLRAAWGAGDLARARRIQLDLLPLCRLIYGEPNPGPLKYALAAAGRSAGPTRPPIYPPSRATTDGLDRLLPSVLAAESAAARLRHAA